MLVVGAGNVQATATDIIDSLIVDEERAVGVFNGAVGRKDGIVGLDDRRGDARCGVDGKLELALLAVVGGETFEEQSTESRSGSATEGVEDEEALKRGAVV